MITRWSYQVILFFQFEKRTIYFSKRGSTKDNSLDKGTSYVAWLSRFEVIPREEANKRLGRCRFFCLNVFSRAACSRVRARPFIFLEWTRHACCRADVVIHVGTPRYETGAQGLRIESSLVPNSHFAFALLRWINGGEKEKVSEGLEVSSLERIPRPI